MRPDIDEEVARLEKIYRNETDLELERKRGVYRSHIVITTQDKIREGASDLEMNQALYDVLSKVVHDRERRKRHQEWAKIVASYLGVLLPFALGLAFADPVKRYLGWDNPAASAPPAQMAPPAVP